MINSIKDNITVREYTKDDFPAFLKQLCRNPKWTNVFGLWDLDDDNAFTFFAHHLKQYEEMDITKNALMLPIFTKNGLLIGECGFEYNKVDRRVEIFLGLIEQARGKGYAKEVVEALCDISKEIGINEIHALVPLAHNVCVHIFDNSKFKFKNEFDLEFENNIVKMKHYIYKN